MSAPCSDAAARPAADAELDARGLRCPEPLMLARNRLRGMARGEVLCILATDPTTERDFKDLCRFMGHVLVSAEHTAGEYHYWIRKA